MVLQNYSKVEQLTGPLILIQLGTEIGQSTPHILMKIMRSRLEVSFLLK